MFRKRAFERLYIHVPFCARKKCDYCAFYSVPNATQEIKKAYLAKLSSYLEKTAADSAPLKSIYFGGGTPTILAADELDFLFQKIRTLFKFAPDIEISSECNPETLDAEKAAVLGSFANRISMGLQTFEPNLRSVIGRESDPDFVYNAVELLNKNSISNLGIDLIYSIPSQSMEQWRRDLEKASKLNIRHISAYSLSIEEGAALAENKNFKIPSDEENAAMWLEAGEFLSGKNFSRYEISNYALHGFECRHNYGIWHGDTYAGCGPAAASFDGSIRYSQVSDLDLWLKGSKPEKDIIPDEKRAREIFVMGLRTASGWNRESFREKADSYDFASWLGVLDKPEYSDLFSYDGSSFRLSERGLSLWDEIAEILL